MTGFDPFPSLVNVGFPEANRLFAPRGGAALPYDK
jgi:hypothetical protein